MGTIIASPETSGTSVNMIPHETQMKKCSTISGFERFKNFISSIRDKNAINQSSPMYSSNSKTSNSTNGDLYDQTMLSKNNYILCETSNHTFHLDNCQFPYYRSFKSNGRYPDAVLVKDVGVSCALLSDNVNSHNTSISGVESYLVKQLKREYNDLSSITNKITTYTKDILNHLSSRDRRKNQISRTSVYSKHVKSSEYTDEKGNFCLKLRLFTDTGTQYSTHSIVKECDDVLIQRKRNAGKIETNKRGPTQHGNVRSEHEKQVQTTFCNERIKRIVLESPICSSTSICDHLIVDKKKSSNTSLRSSIVKYDSSKRNKNFRKSYTTEKECDEEHLKRSNPVILTNWRELSNSKGCKNRTLSYISNPSGTANKKCISRDSSIDQSLPEKSFSNYNTNNHDPKCHTVNIRIIKHKRKSA